MEQTPVSTNTIEEQLVDEMIKLSELTHGEDRETCRPKFEAVVADFRTKFENECFEAWDIAQAFKQDEERDRLLDERRVLKEQQESFHACVGAYNREREKEGKAEHVFKAEGFEKTGDAEHGEVCTHDHDDKERPAE